ncbi:MAG: OmpA family protein [Bdellovibrionales bacterium]|nr:OmpA family protein [Bdellovibrionales bacterium]
MKKLSFITTLVLSVSLAACVSKSKYTELQQTYETEQANSKEKQQKILELETLIAELEKKLGSASDDKEALRASVTQMRTALSEMTARRQEAENRIREYQDLVKRFQKLTEAGQLSIKIVDGRMVVGMPSDVLFASGSAKLSSAGAATVKEVTRLLVDIPNKEYQIEGHTDNVPIKTSQFPSNWELAAARGVNVLETMVEAGMPARRVSAASYGQYRPIAANSTSKGKAANRRIEIVIVPDLSTLPGYEELQKMAPKQAKGDSEPT